MRLVSARRQRNTLARIAEFYGLVSGGLPDFWLALILIYVFYNLLGWVSSPIGRIDVLLVPPRTITGFYSIDGVIDGDWPAVRSAFAHLITPVLTLGLINAGPILKITQSAMEQMLEADFSLYARLCGLSEKLIVRHALRNALPSIVTVVSVIYGFLIGGAVLVETVFSWGGPDNMPSRAYSTPT